LQSPPVGFTEWPLTRLGVIRACVSVAECSDYSRHTGDNIV
jgi:hypothetical protein